MRDARGAGAEHHSLRCHGRVRTGRDLEFMLAPHDGADEGLPDHLGSLAAERLHQESFKVGTISFETLAYTIVRCAG